MCVEHYNGNNKVYSVWVTASSKNLIWSDENLNAPVEYFVRSFTVISLLFLISIENLCSLLCLLSFIIIDNNLY